MRGDDVGPEPGRGVALSICIPVYNCAEFLGEALDSMLPQMRDDLEIVIYDGASTDGTETLVADYMRRSARIRYHRAEARGGIDADLRACIALARGRYCWLFSGDDVMRVDALDKACEAIGSGHDLYLCEHTLCDKAMRFRRDYPVLSPNVAFTADLAIPRVREEWFRRAVSTEAFFSFMSSLIVRRSTWESAGKDNAFDGTCWAHVARLFSLIPRGLLVSYVADTWLDQRGGNDSFRGSGIVKRYALAIDGFERIAHQYFPGPSVEAFHIRRVLRFEFTLGMFLDAKLLCAEHPHREDRELLDRLVAKAYNDPSPWLSLQKVVYRVTPIWSLKAARRVVHSLRRLKRSA